MELERGQITDITDDEDGYIPDMTNKRRKRRKLKLNSGGEKTSKAL